MVLKLGPMQFIDELTMFGKVKAGWCKTYQGDMFKLVIGWFQKVFGSVGLVCMCGEIRGSGLAIRVPKGGVYISILPLSHLLGL